MTPDERVPIVLFVCVENAGRSQMAEALFNRAAEGRALARSAGSRPAGAVHREVAEAMAEVGLDLTGAKPKGLEPAVLDDVDLVVGMGCGDECPFIPGATRIDWDIPDPGGLPLNEVRSIRNHIKHQVELLLAEVAGV